METHHSAYLILEELYMSRKAYTVPQLWDLFGQWGRQSIYSAIWRLERLGYVARNNQRPAQWGITVEGYAVVEDWK